MQVLELTSSLKIIIFCTPLFVFPTFRVSPAHGRASGLFSFFRSANVPMLSQPVEVPPGLALAGSPSSEKMAILAFPDFGFVAFG
jgi:hypothetical protein